MVYKSLMNINKKFAHFSQKLSLLPGYGSAIVKPETIVKIVNTTKDCGRRRPSIPFYEKILTLPLQSTTNVIMNFTSIIIYNPNAFLIFNVTCVYSNYS